MTDRSEAVKLRAEIAEAEAQVKTLTGQIKHREGRLRRIAVDAFNAQSDDAPATTRNLVLGVVPCAQSPIGICVYDQELAEPTDACLFCGARAGVPWPYLSNRAPLK